MTELASTNFHAHLPYSVHQSTKTSSKANLSLLHVRHLPPNNGTLIMHFILTGAIFPPLLIFGSLQSCPPSAEVHSLW